MSVAGPGYGEDRCHPRDTERQGYGKLETEMIPRCLLLSLLVLLGTLLAAPVAGVATHFANPVPALLGRMLPSALDCYGSCASSGRHVRQVSPCCPHALFCLPWWMGDRMVTHPLECKRHCRGGSGVHGHAPPFLCARLSCLQLELFVGGATRRLSASSSGAAGARLRVRLCMRGISPPRDV